MKKRVKRKFNFLKFVIFLIVIFLIYILLSNILNVKTKNIIILNNSFYSDEKIIETSGLENYPKFVLLSKNKIKKRLANLELIDSVIVHKKWGFILELDIKEKKVLYLVRSTDKYKLSDGSDYSSEKDLVTPTLINYVPEEIEKKFIKGFSNINNDVLALISEIEYNKSDYDDNRFLLYMVDGNEVYINISRINLLNKYISIITKLNNKKGILYLDSGNYFEIKN